MFSELLERTIRSGQRYKRPFALMLIDLDRFKAILEAKVKSHLLHSIFSS